jgi:hypothetical protein
MPYPCGILVPYRTEAEGWVREKAEAAIVEPKELITGLWNAMDRRRWHEIADYFCSDAAIFWHNTNERFTVPEFVEANSSYPGRWTIQVERLEEIGDLVISVVDVASVEGGQSCHAVSFFELEGGRIRTLHEYWGDNGRPPQWRIDRKIGTDIS